jgi:large repetitive protein
MLRRTGGLPFRVLAILVVIVTGVLAPSVGSGWAQSLPLAPEIPSRITSPVVDWSRVTIRHSSHSLALAANEIESVEGSLAMPRMVLVLSSGDDQEHQLHTFLDSQQTKGSADYQRWLTPEDFGRRFGVSARDIQQVTSWLQHQGFSVDKVAKSGRWIEFSGNAGQVESAFHTQMRRYLVGGETHLANASDISVPEALAPVVRGVLSLHDFFSKPLLASYYQVSRNAKGELVPIEPQFTFPGPNGTFHFLTPGDYASIYNLSPLYQSGINGQGQAIAIVARSNVALSDIQGFRQIFKLPANDPVFILNGPDPGDFGGNDAVEASLDAEWAGAVAPGATIDLVISASTVTTDGVILSAAYIVDNNVAPILSASFSQCEQTLGPAGNAFLSALWQQAAAQGISVFVASDDIGAAGCDPTASLTPAQHGLAVNALASTPFNTAVGGTEFNENGQDSIFWNSTNGPGFASAKGYIPEMIWNESCSPSDANSPCASLGFFLLTAGGGGASAVYAKPSWQALTIPGMPNDNKRDLPDVSLSAASGHDGYLVCIFGSCQTNADGTVLQNASVVGGTSASSPSFAGIQAIVNQRQGNRQGLANYFLYPLAANENFSNCNSSDATNPGTPSPCVFHDITTGNNGVPGQAGFSAAAGFDLASGLGSVNATNLVNAWGSLSFQGSTTTLNANGGVISVAHGQAVPLTVSVQAISGSKEPTGNISLITDNATTVGAGALTNGSFSGSFNDLPGGQYHLIARYPGDGTFGASDSVPVAVNITSEPTSIVLTPFVINPQGRLVPGTSAAYGDQVNIHAAVTGASGNGAPGGTISFSDGGSPLASRTLANNGEADLVSFGFNTPLTLTVGTHTVSAAYSGDSSFQASGPSQPVTVNITKGNPLAVLEAGGITTFPFGQPFLLHVFVSNSGPVLPTGTVQLSDNGTPVGSPVAIAPPASNQTPQADLVVSSLAVGSHILLAQYLGDSVYNASSTTPDIFDSVTVTVTPASGAATQTTVTPSTNSIPLNQPVNFTVVVKANQTSPVPTDTVTIFNGELGAIGSGTLQNGTAVIPAKFDFPGPQSVVAQYSGDGTYAPGGSAPVIVTVAKATPTVALTASSSSAGNGQQVSLVATISSPALVGGGGLVQFFDAINGGSPQPLGNPQTTTLGNHFIFTVALPIVLPVGTNVITAQYLGDVELNTATSNPVTVTVSIIQFQLAASTSSLVINAGQSGSVSLTLTPGAGFNAATTFACSDLPVAAVCSFSPPSVTPNGAPVTTSVTISTAAPSSSASLASAKRWNPWMGLTGIAVACMFLVVLPGRHVRLRLITVLMVISLLTVTISCGGSGGPPPSGGPVSTSTVLTSSGAKAPQGSGVILTAKVTSSAPAITGSVTFFDGSTQIAQPVNVSGGQAQLQISSLRVGTHLLTAQYGGDSENNGSKSANLQQVIIGSVVVQLTATGGGQTQAAPLNLTIQ